MKVITRFAPSPTGYMHVGSLRTALYNFLFAKQHGGTYLLRIEDTDRERHVEGADQRLIATLKQTGLSPDNKKIPYQSKRLKIYKKYAQQLVEQGRAYHCFCSKDRLLQVHTQQMAAKQQPKYDRHCLGLGADVVADKLKNGEAHVIRLKVPDGITTFTDTIRGEIRINNTEVDDQVLMKSDGYPTYHLANVVDDHLMEVSHVIRGEEWLSSVPKHLILYASFGWQPPVFAHLPLLLNPDKSKLSKRQGDVAVEDFLAQGYLPEALVNFVALLGFNPTADREVYTRDELVRLFDLSRVNKSGAVFAREKLDWMNGHYLRAMDTKQLAKRVRGFMNSGEAKIRNLEKICAIERERAHTLVDLAQKALAYAKPVAYSGSILVWKKSDAADAKIQLRNVLAVFKTASAKTFSSSALIEEMIKSYLSKTGLQNGPVLWPLRVALSGSEQSPGPFELAWMLGKKETLARLQTAIDQLA